MSSSPASWPPSSPASSLVPSTVTIPRDATVLVLSGPRLADGRTVKGFLVEADAAAGALDISQFGGWRAYLAQAKEPTKTPAA